MELLLGVCDNRWECLTTSVGFVANLVVIAGVTSWFFRRSVFNHQKIKRIVKRIDGLYALLSGSDQHVKNHQLVEFLKRSRRCWWFGRRIMFGCVNRDFAEFLTSSDRRSTWPDLRERLLGSWNAFGTGLKIKELERFVQNWLAEGVFLGYNMTGPEIGIPGTTVDVKKISGELARRMVEQIDTWCRGGKTELTVLLIGWNDQNLIFAFANEISGRNSMKENMTFSVRDTLEKNVTYLRNTFQKFGVRLKDEVERVYDVVIVTHYYQHHNLLQADIQPPPVRSKGLLILLSAISREKDQRQQFVCEGCEPMPPKGDGSLAGLNSPIGISYPEYDRVLAFPRSFKIKKDNFPFKIKKDDFRKELEKIIADYLRHPLSKALEDIYGTVMLNEDHVSIEARRLPVGKNKKFKLEIDAISEDDMAKNVLRQLQNLWKDGFRSVRGRDRARLSQVGTEVLQLPPFYEHFSLDVSWKRERRVLDFILIMETPHGDGLQNDSEENCQSDGVVISLYPAERIDLTAETVFTEQQGHERGLSEEEIRKAERRVIGRMAGMMCQEENIDDKQYGKELVKDVYKCSWIQKDQAHLKMVFIFKKKDTGWECFCSHLPGGRVLTEHEFLEELSLMECYAYECKLDRERKGCGVCDGSRFEPLMRRSMTWLRPYGDIEKSLRKAGFVIDEKSIFFHKCENGDLGAADVSVVRSLGGENGCRYITLTKKWWSLEKDLEFNRIPLKQRLRLVAFPYVHAQDVLLAAVKSR